MSANEEHDRVTADLNDAMTSIQAIGEDRSAQVDRFDTEPADVSGEKLDQPNSRG